MLENYEKLPNGVIRQINVEKFTYDIDYVSKYNSYGDKGAQLAGIRLGYLMGSLGHGISSILDVGYGNGNFLKVCSKKHLNCFGHDISNYPLPEGVEFVDNITHKHYDVICFFDVLEHFEDITIVKNLDCDYIYISVPNCYNSNDDEWFENWKHRKPNEHLWHFNLDSLNNFFNEMGYKAIAGSNIEDFIRFDSNHNNNILSVIFKKNK
jgi:hypothetical protein